jgi:hypothetical protein
MLKLFDFDLVSASLCNTLFFEGITTSNNMKMLFWCITLKTKFLLNNIKFHFEPHRKHIMSPTRINQLMLFTETNAIYLLWEPYEAQNLWADRLKSFSTLKRVVHTKEPLGFKCLNHFLLPEPLYLFVLLDSIVLLYLHVDIQSSVLANSRFLFLRYISNFLYFE